MYLLSSRIVSLIILIRWLPQIHLSRFQRELPSPMAPIGRLQHILRRQAFQRAQSHQLRQASCRWLHRIRLPARPVHLRIRQCNIPAKPRSTRVLRGPVLDRRRLFESAWLPRRRRGCEKAFHAHRSAHRASQQRAHHRQERERQLHWLFSDSSPAGAS